MKKLSCLMVAVSLAISSFVTAQNSDNKWYIGVGAHATDHTAVDPFSGYFDTKDYSITPPLSKITLARSLNKSFAVDLQASVGEIDNKRFMIQDQFFVLAGLGLRYKFTNGYLLGENSWFDPYVRVGGNYHNLDYSSINLKDGDMVTEYDKEYSEVGYVDKEFEGKKDNVVINGGLGINFWFTKSFGLNVESQYNYNVTAKQRYADFLQHSASLVFRFGNSDKDKDGILDKDDKCPEVAGLAQFQGCPDTDGDGIQDSEDKCPTEAGPVENNGCPWGDADNDGVKDNEDKCPNVAGPVDNAGCPYPDTDGDGLLDKDDACPSVACPREDSKCKDNGCPKDQEDNAKEATQGLQGLLFDTAKATIRTESNAKLDVASEIIKRGGIYFVDGHTDSSGNAARNKTLSQNRANEVVKALESRGVVAGSLIPRGFGSEQPVADNTTAEGKQQNRRVVINPATTADADKYRTDLEEAAKKAAQKKVKRTKRK
jgi:OOP family OmpA-OmpF porin